MHCHAVSAMPPALLGCLCSAKCGYLVGWLGGATSGSQKPANQLWIMNNDTYKVYATSGPSLSRFDPEHEALVIRLQLSKRLIAPFRVRASGEWDVLTLNVPLV